MSAVDDAAWKDFTELFAGDVDAVAEIVTIYLDESDELRARLMDAVAAQDPQGVARAAHSLKSTSHQLGARQLGDVCGQLEAAGNTKDMVTITALAPRFERLLQDAQGGLRQRIEP